MEKHKPEFAVRNLSMLTYAQGFTLWHYRGDVVTKGATMTDPVELGDALMPGFFQAAAGMLADGDHMHISAASGQGALVRVGMVGGVVTVKVMARTVS